MKRSHIEHCVSRPVPRRYARGTVPPRRRRNGRPAPSTASAAWHGRVWKPVRSAAELARDSALFSEFE